MVLIILFCEDQNHSFSVRNENTTCVLWVHSIKRSTFNYTGIKWSMIELLTDTTKCFSAWTDSCLRRGIDFLLVLMFWMIFWIIPLLLEIKPSVPWIKETTFNFTWIRCSATRGQLRFQSSINISVGTELSRSNARLHFWYNTQNIINTSSYWFLLCCRASLTETVDTRKFRKLFVSFRFVKTYEPLQLVDKWFHCLLTVKLLKFHLKALYIFTIY